MSDKRDTTYWRNVANDGRGSKMTACLHKACDDIDRLERELAAMTERAEKAKTERDAVISQLLKCREEFCWHGNTGKSLSAETYGRLVDEIDATLDAARKVKP